jgi:regulator of cell morphogenesis and NO signaling
MRGEVMRGEVMRGEVRRAIDTSTDVADIVTERPGTARVFERLGIDYCCRGRRPLRDACVAAGLDTEAVAIELAGADDPDTSPPPGDVAGLIGHIVATHHTSLRRELPRLDDLMGRVVAAHGARHPEVLEVARMLAALADELLPHLVKEERILFPAAIELLGAVGPTPLPCGSVIDPIRVMHAEHDRAGELLAALRHTTAGYVPPDDACPTWIALYHELAELEADVHRHVHLENNVLFPRVIELEASLT